MFSAPADWSADFVRQSLTKFNKSTAQAREMKEALRIL